MEQKYLTSEEADGRYAPWWVVPVLFAIAIGIMGFEGWRNAAQNARIRALEAAKGGE